MLPSRCRSLGRLIALRRAAPPLAAAAPPRRPRPRPSSSSSGGYDSLPPLDLAAVLRSSPAAAAVDAREGGGAGRSESNRPLGGAVDGAGGHDGDWTSRRAEARENLARVREMISGDGGGERPAASPRRKRSGKRRRGRRRRGGRKGPRGASGRAREGGDSSEAGGGKKGGLDTDGTSSPAPSSAEPAFAPRRAPRRGGDDDASPAVPDFSAGTVVTQADGTSFCRSGGTAVLATATLAPPEDGAGREGARGLFLESTRRAK